jgi:cyanate lyase
LKSIGYVIIILILYFIFLGMFDPFNQEKTSEPPKVEQLKKVLKETPKEKVVEVIPVDPLTLSIDEMTMSDGVTYREVTFSKITNGKIIVKHSDGAMRIKLEELPDAVRARIATE